MRDERVRLFLVISVLAVSFALGPLAATRHSGDVTTGSSSSRIKELFPDMFEIGVEYE